MFFRGIKKQLSELFAKHFKSEKRISDLEQRFDELSRKVNANPVTLPEKDLKDETKEIEFKHRIETKVDKLQEISDALLRRDFLVVRKKKGSHGIELVKCEHKPEAVKA